jgi:SAM-dependent methyltransferase
MPYKRLFLGNPASEVTSWTGVDIRPVGDRQGDAHALPYADESFDTVLCTNVLPYCLSPLQVLGECYRVLRKGGMLVVCAANTYEDDGEMLWGVRESGLGDSLLQCGFRILDMGKHSGLWREEASNFTGADKYGVAVSGSFDTWVGALDAAFPLLTSAIAAKE